MAFVSLDNYKKYTCASTDTKLTTGVRVGSTCWETDTSKIYIFDGSAWDEKIDHVQVTGSMTPKAGQKNVTTSGTQVPLLAATQVYQRVKITALPTNTGNIYQATAQSIKHQIMAIFSRLGQRLPIYFSLTFIPCSLTLMWLVKAYLG